MNKIVCHKCRKLLGYLLMNIDDKDNLEISEIAEDTKDNVIVRFFCKECVEEKDKL